VPAGTVLVLLKQLKPVMPWFSQISEPPVVVKLGACRHCAGSVETVETSDIVVQSNQRTSSRGKTGRLQALCWFC